ncbi:MAG: septum formation initiator family protein [Lachnospiraceae bacterium]|nr:septum formation initiator family protein [Lachnospiraceae bacterium]
MAGSRRKPAWRRKTENRLTTIIVIGVLALLLIVVGIGSIRLKNQRDEYKAKEAYYEALIAEEEKRAEELVEFDKYTKTNKYMEEVAKQKLGLVKDGEIVFIAEK